MGLDGRVTGLLTVSERPGRATTGQGQLARRRHLQAYGQNLQIQHGQLLFASTPIDNPGLNIRAVRKLNPNATIDEGQEVGLLVTGTAQRPILTVFSNPAMEQSDALSYLITGKPLSEVKGGEGDMVSAAAQALGSAARRPAGQAHRLPGSASTTSASPATRRSAAARHLPSASTSRRGCT